MEKRTQPDPDFIGPIIASFMYITKGTKENFLLPDENYAYATILTFKRTPSKFILKISFFQKITSLSIHCHCSQDA